MKTSLALAVCVFGFSLCATIPAVASSLDCKRRTDDIKHALGGDSIPTSLAFGRVTNEGLRAAVYSTTPGGVLYEDFAIDQNDWGSQAFATGVAFGDVDGDVFPEFGVTRYHTSGMRAAVFDDTIGDHAPIATVGSDWHSSATAAAIAFGDIDGDGVDEMAVARWA